MLIQCTRKLLDELKIKPGASAAEEPLFCWHANLIRLNRRKTVVLMNDKTRYVIVLYGLKAQDFDRLDEHIIQAIRETLKEELIKDEVIEHYINHAGKVAYTNTKDRTSVARMNKACDMVFWVEDLMVPEVVYQSGASKKINRFIVGDGANRYVRPCEEFFKDLETFAGKPVFGCQAVELKVTLALAKYNVWRRLVVPINITFDELHKVIQAAFGWKDCHLHEFYIYSDESFDDDSYINHPGYHREGCRPVVNLVCDEEALSYEKDVPVRLEAGIRLAEYLPARMKYNYDFGDNWQHYIEVERVIADYDKNYPVCLAGEGNTPPEDVGGECGYEEFLEIIADERHPEHKRFAAWAASQGYQEFDIERVNRALRVQYRM